MIIRRFESDLLSSNMYLIEENGHAVVIDPFRDTSMTEGLAVDLILLTHEHYDHISGVNLWKDKTHAKVLCSRDCGANMRDPKKSLARIFEVFCELQTWIKLDHLPDADASYSSEADETFEDEITFLWQGHRFRLFTLPGHSMGGTGILLDEKYFFSGDSLMEDREVELRFPGGSKKLWEEISAERLHALPDDITVYPGHFSEFTYHKS